MSVSHSKKPSSQNLSLFHSLEPSAGGGFHAQNRKVIKQSPLSSRLDTRVGPRTVTKLDWIGLAKEFGKYPSWIEILMCISIDLVAFLEVDWIRVSAIKCADGLAWSRNRI